MGEAEPCVSPGTRQPKNAICQPCHSHALRNDDCKAKLLPPRRARLLRALAFVPKYGTVVIKIFHQRRANGGTKRTISVLLNLASYQKKEIRLLDFGTFELI